MLPLKTPREKIIRKKTAPVILIMFNTFVWYLLLYAIFNNMITSLSVTGTDKLSLFACYYLGVAVTAVIGAKFFSGAKSSFLQFWLFLGATATILLFAFSDNMIVNFFLASFVGASIGLGLPSCLSYFADSTSIESRGIVGGITWGIVGLTVVAFAVLISMLGLFEAILLVTGWRLFGSVCFPFLDRFNKKPEVTKAPSYSVIIRKRELLLYLFPWVMFSLVNFAEQPMLGKVFGTQTFAFVQLVEFLFVGIFAIVGGAVADIAGRKRVVIAGFIMLGIEYASMSVFAGTSDILYLFLTLDGITWGLFFSVFLSVIWGDIGGNYEKEKFYVLGGVPFLLGGLLSIIIQPFAQNIPTGTAFSLASFFLFVAVIPLMYAPETLPEKTMKDRELKNYLEKAQKFAQKQAEKSQHAGSKKNRETKESDDENEQDPNEYEEARKLAEKYY